MVEITLQRQKRVVNHDSSVRECESMELLRTDYLLWLLEIGREAHAIVSYIKLHKMGYLLQQQLKNKFHGYEFNDFLYGPYSPELSDDLIVLQRLRQVDNQSRREKNTTVFDVCTTQSGCAYVRRVVKPLLVELLGKKQYEEFHNRALKLARKSERDLIEEAGNLWIAEPLRSEAEKKEAKYLLGLS